jgi:HlyD family secretion protein
VTTSPQALAEEDEVPGLRRPVVAGFATILVAFGGFFGWACFARLDAAAIAPGVVIADSKRKSVQHLEGGIVAEILVRDGDRVGQGEVLIRMDPTFAGSRLGQLETQLGVARARLVRLRAEAAGSRDPVAFDPLLAQTAGEEARQIVLDSRAHFLSRWQDFDSRIGVLEQRVVELTSEIAALDANIESAAEQLGYTRDELAAAEQLYAKGFERRTRILELRRSIAELAGRRDESIARRAQAEQAIVGTKLAIRHEHDLRRTEIAADLVEMQAAVADLEDELGSARDVLRRVDVRAPQDGLVTNLQVFGPGAVLHPGDPILDIVPLEDELVIETMIEPHDIDSVHVGAAVNVRLTAYKQKSVPVIEGTLTYVAADRQIDPRTGAPFYPGRVTLSSEALDRLSRVDLYPGMPTEVMILTGKRRALDYFLSPITDGLSHAFREE